MKVVILAGGLGTRISEESHLKPKPMIEIGELPILVHIMKGYAAQGFNDFIILAGYKQRVIKEYFAHYFLYNNDVTFNMQSNERIINNISNKIKSNKDALYRIKNSLSFKVGRAITFIPRKIRGAVRILHKKGVKGLLKRICRKK